jgi:hypothetical protein
MNKYDDLGNDDNLFIVGKITDDDGASQDEIPIYIVMIFVLLFAVFLCGLVIYLSWRHERYMQSKRQGTKLTSSAANFLWFNNVILLVDGYPLPLLSLRRKSLQGQDVQAKSKDF